MGKQSTAMSRQVATAMRALQNESLQLDILFGNFKNVWCRIFIEPPPKRKGPDIAV